MDVEIQNYMKNLNLDEICRTCLSECEEMISVHTEIEPTEDDEISYVYQILMKVASIQVTENDGLPTLICKNCIESANNAFKYKILCERSESLLQTYLNLKEQLPLENNDDDESTEYIDGITYDETVEEVVEIDHNYITEDIYNTDTEFHGNEELIETLEESDEETACLRMQKTIKIINEVNSNLLEDGSDTIDEELIERLDEEFQTEEEEIPNFTNFQTEIPTDAVLAPVEVEVLNCDDTEVQNLIIKQNIPFQPKINSDKEPKKVLVLTTSEDNIKLRERIKQKKLSTQTRVTKPKKKYLNYPWRINENGEKMFMCPNCNKEYKHSNSLKVHIRTHTLERPYVCKVCRKTFAQLTALTYHMRSHTGETPYQCTVCDKRYRQSASLTAHMRIHTGQRPFLCSVCGKGFRQAPDLGYHMRTHTKEKPYMCNVCGKCMSMQCHLVQHMRTHTGEKPYECKECGKCFASSTRLKRHAIIHTGAKPFECDVCNKSFNRAGTLKVHALTHAEKKPFVCEVCGKGFIQQHCLKSHSKTHVRFEEVFLKNEELKKEEG